MSISRDWCDVCRGDLTSSDVVLDCTTCPRRFHAECVPKTKKVKRWRCVTCIDADADDEEQARINKSVKDLNVAVKRVHEVTLTSCHFILFLPKSILKTAGNRASS